MPRLERVKVPVLYSSGLSCLVRERATKSAQLREREYKSVLSALASTGVIRPPSSMATATATFTESG